MPDTTSRASPIHGTGLFATRHLPLRHTLGHFTGKQLSAQQFAQRQAAGRARCLVHFISLEGTEVFLDGCSSTGVSFINSVAGTSLLPNCHFVCDGVTVAAVTLRAVVAGEELLADYSFDTFLGGSIDHTGAPPAAPGCTQLAPQALQRLAQPASPALQSLGSSAFLVFRPPRPLPPAVAAAGAHQRAVLRLQGQ